MGLQQLKNQVFSKKEGFTDEDLIKSHDVLMVEYGWIPLEEFKKLPIPTLISFLNCIGDRRKKEAEQMKHKGR